MQKFTRTQKALLFIALGLTLALFAFDRYAAYAYRPAPDSKIVVLYTTEWCGYCARLRQDLAASNIPYVEHDVEKSLQGQLGFWTLRGRGVPVSAIGPKVIHGYQIEEIAAALQQIGYSLAKASTTRQ